MPSDLATPPPEIEGYQIIGKLGESGQGQIWRAIQLSTRRQVALKVPRIGLLSYEKVLARFEREVELVAQLQHANIARIHDSGLRQGVYYYAMDLIEGVHLDEYVAQNDLGRRQVLELMVTICRAIQYAHQMGVMHRDLKPSNIIVTKEGHPYIVDFGLAKAVSDSGPVGTISLDGDIAGTPAFMSPEQAAGHTGQIDTRTDVYSLGVILFVLLTGRHPYDLSGSHLDVLHRIMKGEMIQPRRLSPKMDRDLEAVLLKALEHDPDRRYSSAAGLAEDIDHYLDGLPLSATPRSRVRRIGSFVRRHRIGVALGLLTSAAGLAAVIILAVSTVIISQEKRRAQEALDREQQALAQETVSRTEAQRQAKIAQAVATFVSDDLLGSVDPTGVRDEQASVREVLDAVSLTVAAKFGDEPLAEAAVRQTLGDTYSRLDNCMEAIRHLERARQLHREHLKEDDPAAIQSMAALGAVYRRQGRLQEAESLLRPGLELAERALGEEHWITFSCMNEMALLLSKQRRPAEAEPLFRRALGLQKRVLGEGHLQTASTMQNLADLSNGEKRHAEAVTLYREVADIKRRQLGPNHPRTLYAQCNLAISLRMLGQHAEAEALLVKTFEDMKLNMGEEDYNVIPVMVNLVTLYMIQGQPEKAEPLQRKVVELRTRVHGEEHRETIVHRRILATLYRRLGRSEEAESQYLKTLETAKHALGERHPLTLALLSDLASLYRELQRYQDAEPLYTQVVEAKARVLGAEHAEALAAADDLAAVYCDWDRLSEAEPLLLKTMQSMKRMLGGADPDTLNCMSNLAMLRHKQGRTEEAESLWRESTETAQRALAEGHPRAQALRRVLVNAYRGWEKPAEAQKWQASLSAHDLPPTTENGIPEENLKVPADMQACADHLREIYAALGRYQKDKGTWPDWLSDLIPDYLPAEMLFCPDDAKHSSHLSDPLLPCSYAWELTLMPVPKEWDATGKTTRRELRMREATYYGDTVPMVACAHHGEYRILNVSLGGQIYWGPSSYVSIFQTDYRLPGEQSFQRPQPAVQPGQSADQQARPTARDTPRLVAHWTLDESSGDVAHDSAGGHDGVLHGDPAWLPTGGVIGGALHFDGVDDYVDTGYTEDLATWTVSTWVRSPAAPTIRGPTGPVHRDLNYQINWDHIYPNSPGTAAVCARDTWCDATFGPLEADRWYHLAATYDGEALRTYRDGALVATNDAPSGDPSHEVASLKFGRHAADTVYFRGTVDDVRIYNYALTPEEVQALHTGGNRGALPRPERAMENAAKGPAVQGP